MLYEVITLPVILLEMFFDVAKGANSPGVATRLADVVSPGVPVVDDYVITSYSIHYTKLYDAGN